MSYGEQVVVALAFPSDYYCPQMTFMDARTFEILPIPSHWMALLDRPQAVDHAAGQSDGETHSKMAKSLRIGSI
ncbi:MAG TPA: hypothetical protein VEW25_03245 [Allosphingosinicella sp.]|nr:hypothetical protein [Allosphingosinicella sp.]